MCFVWCLRCGTMRKTVTNIRALKVYVFIFCPYQCVWVYVWSQSLVESCRGACPESVCNVGDLLVMRFVMKIGMFNINNNKNSRSGWNRESRMGERRMRITFMHVTRERGERQTSKKYWKEKPKIYYLSRISKPYTMQHKSGIQNIVRGKRNTKSKRVDCSCILHCNCSNGCEVRVILFRPIKLWIKNFPLRGSRTINFFYTSLQSHAIPIMYTHAVSDHTSACSNLYIFNTLTARSRHIDLTVICH